MPKKNKNYLFLFFLFYFAFFNFQNSVSNEDLNFLSLKNKKVNMRSGPSFDHPIKLIYKKKYLPVVVLDKFETWREIKDFQNNSGWIHVSQLSKKKAAIVIDDEAYIFSSNTIYSKPLAISKRGKLLLIKKCKKNWCKITSGKYTGWIDKSYLWGKTN